jgi:hypothetical protein
MKCPNPKCVNGWIKSDMEHFDAKIGTMTPYPVTKCMLCGGKGEIFTTETTEKTEEKEITTMPKKGTVLTDEQKAANRKYQRDYYRRKREDGLPEGRTTSRGAGANVEQDAGTAEGQTQGSAPTRQKRRSAPTAPDGAVGSTTRTEACATGSNKYPTYKQDRHPTLQAGSDEYPTYKGSDKYLTYKVGE